MFLHQILTINVSIGLSNFYKICDVDGKIFFESFVKWKFPPDKKLKIL